jgi:hypothetical protein
MESQLVSNCARLVVFNSHPGGKSLMDILDIENHDKVLCRVIDNLIGTENNKQLSIDAGLMKELHRSLFPADGGEYKKEINYTFTKYAS